MTLKFACPSCSTKLAFQDAAEGIVEIEKEHRKRTIREIVRMALADNSISAEERDLLETKAKEFGMETRQLNSLIQQEQNRTIVPTVDASEDVIDVTDRFHNRKTGFFDTFGMAEFILSVGDSGHLKKHRDTFVEMVEANAETWKCSAKQWDRLYDRCNDPTEYDEILEHRETAISYAREDRHLADELRFMSKAEFLNYCNRLASANDKTDDW